MITSKEQPSRKEEVHGREYEFCAMHLIFILFYNIHTFLRLHCFRLHMEASAQDEVENRRPYLLGRSGRQWTSGTIIPLRKASISEADTPQTLTR